MLDIRWSRLENQNEAIVMQAQSIPPHTRRLERLSRHIEPAPCAAHAHNTFFTPEEMQQYEELGYVVVRSLLSDSEVQRFCSRFKRRVRLPPLALLCPSKALL